VTEEEDVVNFVEEEGFVEEEVLLLLTRKDLILGLFMVVSVDSL